MTHLANQPGPRGRTRGSTGRALLIALAFSLVVLVAAAATYMLLSRPPPQPQANLLRSATPPARLVTTLTANAPITNSATQQPASSLEANPTATNLSASELVANLSAIDLAHGPLAPAQATAWKQTLKLLAAKGPAAIPAIREFLGRNQDVNFDKSGAAALLGTASLRLALLGALEAIGGPEAIATAQATLRNTTDPVELVVLAKFLDRAEPATPRAEFTRAAKDTLALAATGSWDGRDVAPLLELLRTFGGAAELAELERYANHWFNYIPITLAHWPDGAGLPLLIKLAQNASGSITLGQDVYQRMLAEMAVNSPAAADAFVELVHENKIDANIWPAMERTLAGHTLHIAKSGLNPPSPLVSRPDTRSYHLAYGNQNFLEATLPEETSASALRDRICLIDRLISATTSPPAMEVLINVRATLSARLPKAN